MGRQTFSDLIEEGFLYVDKTDLVYRMTHSNSKYIFLSRPRRFGKSLLVSTLKSYFEGRKDLFRGLAMERLETEWTQYPVLHFSMSTAKHMDKERLESELNLKLLEYERVYGRREGEAETNQRLLGLVKRAYEQTGRRVVVLIDEYDAPLLDVVHEDENLPKLRQVMRNFYSPLKDLDPYLRFVFLTGITKFSQLSIFSELNNTTNISMDENYASICGITEEEMLTQMKPGIERLAEKKGISYEEAVETLKQAYDGYHFTWPSPDIYNPYSLLNALDKEKTGNYWFGSGTPTYLIEMLRKFGVEADEIGGQYANAESFDAPTETMTDAMPLLYQSGYITIKGQDSRTEEYLLDMPNTEVRVGLMKSLMPCYVTPRRGKETYNLIAQLYKDIDDGKMEEALELLKTFLSTIPYTENTDYEGHYQALLYVLFSLLGQYNVDIEVRTAKGRVDMVLQTGGTIYLFELKFNKSSEEAAKQIDIRNYPERFALRGLPVVKVGLNFDSQQRTIADWTVVTA
ncbi:MAG: ATP-binding protein [Prevotellaceae bacterium]|nr:ATP-binding protein [Prevotellaceae bacterium]